MKIGPLKIGPMQILLVAFAMVMTTANAEAQGMGGSHKRQAKSAKTEPQQPRADDKAYNAALKGIPNKQFDPWHAVR